MQNTIIIIESPNKVDKISHITGAKVYATKGHFKELTDQIVIDYDSYEPSYQMKENSKFHMNGIFNDCKGKDVIIATDPDREGYGIGYMVYETIKNVAKSIKRAEFHEITESGIKKGLDNAIPFVNSNLNDWSSFKARWVADKLVGWTLSPKYAGKMCDKHISIGRVQTPALAMIVKRELEIKDFYENKENAKIDYKLKVKLKTADGVEFSAVNDNIFTQKEEAQAKIAELKGEVVKVFEIQTKQTEQKPPEPFRTSQLQEVANKRLEFSSEKTMSLAQELFSKGLITYHRTDSNSLSNEFIDEVGLKFGSSQWYERREYKAGSQSQAEAHEAVRISHIHEYDEIEAIANEEKLSSDEKALYELIYLNSIQSQAKNAINENTIYDFNIKALSFKTKTTKQIYKGFKDAIVATTDDDEKDKDSQEVSLNLKKGDEVEVIEFLLQDVKKTAPAHYKESNFISLLEKAGIGRPSTYATFLPTLLKREYVKIEIKGKNHNIIATPKGIALIAFCQSDDEWITQSEYTKHMEDILDDISSGKIGYLDFLKPLHDKLGGEEINSTSTPNPPSQKQLEYAKKIAQTLSVSLPGNIENSWKICSDFIEENKKKYDEKNIRPPSQKQLNWAKQIADFNKVELPKNIEKDIKICSDFIDKYNKKK